MAIPPAPPQPPSGTRAFQPAFTDLLLDSFSRIQVRPGAITADHMFQARMSANLMLAEWSIKAGVNLWEVVLQSIPLVQGVATYAVPASTVSILDYYIRQFQIGSPVNLTNAFSTVIDTSTITVTDPNHGLAPGNWFVVPIQVAIGGIIIYGQYQVVTVPTPNTFTFTAANQATGTVTNGGVVPQFTSVALSQTITVVLPNHGLYANQSFTVAVPTEIGGGTLSGPYTVATVIDANTFTFQSVYIAGAAQTVFENGGMQQVSGVAPNTQPQDRVIFPIGRSEYADQPNKSQQAFPTTVWFDRLINPVVTLWPTPDQNGPYQLFYYALQQVQDVQVPGGTTLDVPYRFLEAFAGGLAGKLAVKFPPPPPNSIQNVVLLGEQAWTLAAQQDAEMVPFYISPAFSSYTR